MSKKQIILSLLKLSAFLVFIGRAYQFYFFGAPFRAFFWDEHLLTKIVEGLSDSSWHDYATNLTVNTWITNFTKLCSFLLVIVAFTCLFWDRIASTSFKKTITSISLFILIFFGYCMVKDIAFSVLQFLELSIQIAICLIFFLNNDIDKINIKQLTFLLKIAVAFTFIAHGIFAMGIFILPGHFIDMTIQILGVNETQARLFLHIVGGLDILFSILLFVPKLSKYALLYIITWGLLTAVARLASGFNPNFILKSFHNYTYLVLYRLPHGLIPLTILFLITKSNLKSLKS